MLVVTTKDEVFDLRWADGRHVVLYGPRRGDWRVWVKLAGSADPARIYRVPEPRERMAVRIGPVAFAFTGSDRPGKGQRGVLAFELPPDCRLIRRPRERRRRAG